MLLRRLQQTGHKPIVLMGGGTGKIGDPSFKDEARKLLAEDGIKANVASIKRIFERFLTFGDGPSDAVMLDNAQWLDALEYIPFLRAVRSEERRVGKGCVRTCRSRLAPSH